MSDSTNATMSITLRRDATDADEAWLEDLGERVGSFTYSCGTLNGQPRTLDIGVNEAHVLDGIGEFYEEARDRFGNEIEELLIWEDPAYEYLGTLYRWRPEWGEERFEAQCDADGNVVLTEPRLQALLDEEDPITAIRRELGWIGALT